MILAIDVYYYENGAKVVGLLFESWETEDIKELISFEMSNILEYESGSFYKRELPCILELLKRINISEVNFIIIDGFVYLDDNFKLGLGGYLYENLNKKIPIIGVAKKGFYSLDKNMIKIFRGKSENPLFITSAGIDLEESSEYIKLMSGNYRFPYLLKMLDQETRK